MPYRYNASLPSLVNTSCSLYMWVCFFFVIFTSLLYFLESTYKWYHTIFVFFCLISLAYLPCKVHPCCCKWQNFLIFYGWVVLICVCVCVCVRMCVCLYILVFYFLQYLREVEDGSCSFSTAAPLCWGSMGQSKDKKRVVLNYWDLIVGS